MNFHSKMSRVFRRKTPSSFQCEGPNIHVLSHLYFTEVLRWKRSTTSHYSVAAEKTEGGAASKWWVRRRVEDSNYSLGAGSLSRRHTIWEAQCDHWVEENVSLLVILFSRRSSISCEYWKSSLINRITCLWNGLRNIVDTMTLIPR